MPAPSEAASADEESLPGVVGGEGGGKERRQRRHRAIHQPDEARLDDLQQEEPALRLALGGQGVGREMLRLEPVGKRSMLLLGRGQIDEELRMAGSALRFGGLAVEAIIFEFHDLGALADRIERPYAA